MRSKSVSILVMIAMILQVFALSAFRPARVQAAGSKTLLPKTQWKEEESLRSANARHFRAGDYMVAELHATPVHAKDSKGRWQPIDRTLHPAADGAFATDTGNYKAQFTNKPEKNQITFDLGKGRKIGLEIGGAKNADASGQTRGKPAFAATAAGNKIKYKDNNGFIDYEYETDELSVKETITLRKYPGVSEFFLPITIEGLDIRHDGNGGYSLIDRETHEVRSVITPPMVVDAAGQGTSGIRQWLVDQGNGPGIVISIDHDWLTAPERKYPVVIDPSVVVAPEGADLMAATIMTPSSGQVNSMTVYKASSTDERVALLKFNLTSIPQGAQVYQAALDVTRPINVGSQTSIGVYDVKTEWYPPAVTWTSPRGQGTTWSPGGDVGTTSYGNLTAGPVTLTSLVQFWVNRTRDNNGVLLRKEQLDASMTTLSGPTLQVIYALDVVAPTASISGLADWAAVTGPFTLSVRAADLAPGRVGRVNLVVDGTVAETVQEPSAETVPFTIDPRRFGSGSHTISAQVFDYAGNRAETTPVHYQADIPARPTGMTAASSGNLVTVNWNPPVGGSNVTYNLYRSRTHTNSPTQTDLIASRLVEPTYADLLEKPLAETYYYYVSAVDGGGAEGSLAFVKVEFPFAPGTPQVKALDVGQQVRVEWPPSPRPGITYSLYRGDRPGFVLSAETKLAAGLSGTPYVDGLNNLPNGSFESGPVTEPRSWSGFSSFPLSAAVDSTEAMLGSRSVRMWQAASHQYQTWVVSGTPLPLTGPSTISGWSKAKDVTGSPDSSYSLYAIFRDKSGNTITSAYLPFSVGTHDWEQKSYTYPGYGNEPYYVSVFLQFTGAHTGTVWFDGVQIELGQAASSYQEAIPIGPSPVYAVTAVDAITDEVAVESGSSLEGTVNFQRPTAPGVPTFQTLGGGLVSLSWAPSPESNITYNVYRTSPNLGLPPTREMRVASGLTGTAFLDGTNRLLNSSFETTNSSGIPLSWSTIDNGSCCPQSVPGGYLGDRSLLLSRSSTASQIAGASQLYYLYQGYAAPVTLSVYSRTENVTTGTAGDFALVATFYDYSRRHVGSLTIALAGGTHGWERKAATFFPTAPIESVTVSLQLGGASTGRAWLDNVQLEAGPNATDWREGMPVGSGQYYLVRAVSQGGMESQNSNWQFVNNNGGVITPVDLEVRNFGNNRAEMTWSPIDDYRYVVERATVTTSGYVGPYQQVAVGLTGGAYRSGKNLLSNASFEDDSNYDYVPDGWSYSGSVSRQSPAFQGARSLYLVRARATDPATRAWRDVTINQSMAYPLTLSGMILSNCVNAAPSIDFGLRLELLDGAGNVVGVGTAQGPSGCTATWQNTSITVTPTSPAKTARVSALIGGSVTGYAHFDAVQLEAGPKASAYQDESMVEGTTYSYRITPISPLNSYGAPSQAVTIKASGDPLPVTDQTAQSGTDGRIALAWQASVTPDVTYSVYRTTIDKEPSADDLIASEVATTAFVDSANLLANSGFDRDQDQDNVPDGWTSMGDKTALLVTKGTGTHGTALQITRSTTAAPTKGITSTLTLRQSNSYPLALSASAKTSGLTAGSGNDATVTVRLIGFDGQNVGTAVLPFAPGSDWARKSASVTPTAAVKTAVVEVTLKGSATGTVQFDAIQLQPGTQSSDWVEGPVTPGRQYYYRIAAVTAAGRAAMATERVNAISRSWTPLGPAGDPPGAGLDDRWAFVDMAVPGGTGYLNVNTGNLVITATDSVVPGPRLAQVFRRTYNSMATGSTGPLGSGGWSLNITQKLVPDAASGNVTLHEGDGGEIRFTANPDGAYTAPPSVWMSLSKTSGTYAWKIARRDGIIYEFDAQGRIRRFSEPNGNAIFYDYDASGRLVKVSGPSALTSTLTYDAAGRVIRITDAGGKETAYAYDTTGRLTKVTDPLGVAVTYAYDATGRLASMTDGAGRQVLLGYHTDGRLAAYRWAGVTGGTTFAYSETDELHRTSIANGLNQTTELVTNAVGNLIETRDALGNTTLYDYDDWQRLVQVSSPRGLVTEIKYEEGVTPRVSQITCHAEEEIITTYGDYSTHDAPGRVTDPTGLTTITTFDSAGNPRTITTAAGTEAAATTTYTYTATGMPLTITDALGQQTTYQTDGLGRITAITNPLGGTTAMIYDQAGNLISQTDPNGNTTHHVYDAAGRRTQTANPDGGLAAWRYDPSGLLVEAVAPGNIRTTYRYDGAGRPIATVDGLGNTTRLLYDDAWNPILTFLPNGSLARQEYDEMGRVVRQYSGEYLTDSGTPISSAPYTAYTYDAAGNLIKTRLPNGYEATAEYDLLNRTIKVTQSPNTLTYTYDKAGRVLGVKDGNGNWTRYQYDAAGSLSQVYDAANLTAAGEAKPNAQFTAYGYDKLGRRISVTDPLGRITRYEYNALGQVTRETDPIGQMTLSFYDRAGQLLTRMDRNGNMTDYDYDAMGRVLTVHYQDDWRGVKYTYDAGGRRTSMTDRTGITYYRYDARGQLVEEASPNGTLSYEYDAAGLRTALHLAEGTIGYHYDRSNRIKHVTGVNGAISTFRYGAAGEVLEVNLPGNVTQTNTYDSATNRLTTRKYTHTSGRLLTFTYGYDPVGNVNSIATQDTWEGSRNLQVKYEYDELYRLLYEYSAGPNGNKYAAYSYDGHGNRVREEAGTYTLSGTTYNRSVTDYTVHQYSPANWLVRSTKYNPSNTFLSETEYAYDGEGNLLMALVPNRTERYTYDAANRLIRAQVNNKFTYNSYDGDGRRVQRRVVDLHTDINSVLSEYTTSSSHYQYDGLFVVAERDGADALRVAYTRTDGGRLLSWFRPQQTGETSGAYLVDHLGSVVKMTGASNGAAVNQYDYDAFGKVTTLAEGVPNDMKFTGALLDSSGLYHLSARFYQPSTGRFVTQDTYKGSPWEPWTQNLYVYVGNNPINFIDPTGHAAECTADAEARGECTTASAHSTYDDGNQPGRTKIIQRWGSTSGDEWVMYDDYTIEQVKFAEGVTKTGSVNRNYQYVVTGDLSLLDYPDPTPPDFYMVSGSMTGMGSGALVLDKNGHVYLAPSAGFDLVSSGMGLACWMTSGDDPQSLIAGDGQLGYGSLFHFTVAGMNSGDLNAICLGANSSPIDAGYGIGHTYQIR